MNEKQWFQILLTEIETAYDTLTIAPTIEHLWRAFEITSLDHITGIILGQDPYPNLKHANGLAFSVAHGITIPASLRSIFFELKRSHDTPVSPHGDLSSWAKQGILLLNQTLVLDMETKRPPLTIDSENWTRLTQSIITYILDKKDPIFLLAMGKKAQKSAKSFLLADNLYIINTPHPSPLAAIGVNAKPFIGCGCFEEIDLFLQKHHLPIIQWDLNEPF
ncbi:uracil-DNA glycosylase [Entomospira entomophila]|uniref:Uracil-DNA glycosylase n=1 Tax=Entomospira entomophila TaxID=2719988 RepID=A0A968KTH8_9SPIO|nr:uracil-DNA glycosylase [Entomospira entomophilus]NIZ40336.1 uracil-DNA glycosylase [Entomospira entomophilus]WDI35895.1 uracil-DNA glycosylase [Entomospira entomophilus]